MSPEARARVAVKTEKLRKEMALAELRRARELSQQELAQTLGVGQAAIAKMEKRADMYISTLRRFIEAMGGELRIIAHFPGKDVQIENFIDVNE